MKKVTLKEIKKVLKGTKIDSVLKKSIYYKEYIKVMQLSINSEKFDTYIDEIHSISNLQAEIEKFENHTKINYTHIEEFVRNTSDWDIICLKPIIQKYNLLKGSNYSILLYTCWLQDISCVLHPNFKPLEKRGKYFK